MHLAQRRAFKFNSILLARSLHIAIALASAIGAVADDWPQWRGPHRDGEIGGFKAPDKWPERLTQKWKVLVGVGDSTPALVADKLYVFGRQDADEVIQCLDSVSGKAIWENRYPANHVVTGPPARHPGTRSSPAIAENKLCALGVGGILSCLDIQSGKVLWRKQSAEDYQGIAWNSDTGMSPLLEDATCFIHVGGKTNGAFFAFDLATGTPKWKWTGDRPAFSSPVVMTVGSTKLLVTLTSKSVIGLRLADGKLLWQLPFEATQGNNTTPIIDGQTVIYTGQGQGIFGVRVDEKGGEFTVSSLWTNKQIGPRFTTPVLKEGMLYGYSGHFFCANAQTGATAWEDTANRGNSGALVDVGSVMIALTVNSELTVFRPNAKEYSELAHFKVAETETWAHPVVTGNRIFVRDRENIALWTIE